MLTNNLECDSQISALGSLYNGESAKNLNEALESLRQQTKIADEVVLVIDGPINAELEDTLTEWGSKLTLSLCRLEQNLGLGLALNEGLKFCRHDIVARFDTDDINRPQRFEKQFNFLISSGVDVVSSAIEEFHFNVGDTKRVRFVPLSNDDVLKKLLFSNPVNHAAAMYKRSTVMAVGGYVSFPSFEDYHLWSRVLSNGGKIQNTAEVLVDVRIGNDMLRRRRGITYFINEIRFGFWLSSIGLHNNLSVCCLFFMRALTRLLPKTLLGVFYSIVRRFQRKYIYDQGRNQ